MRDSLLTLLQSLFTLLLYLIGALVIGLSMWPGALLVGWVWQGTGGLEPVIRVMVACLTVAGGYFLYGFTLILLVGLLRILFCLNLREGRYPIPSLGAMKWFIANALQTVVSITFMDFILLTPFAALFFNGMGARVGSNVQINSKNCADLSLLEIGSGSVIGGHATVIGHVFEKNCLVLRRVRIGRQAVIGLNAVVLPGAEIGDRAMVAAGAVVPKNKKVEAGSTYTAHSGLSPQ